MNDASLGKSDRELRAYADSLKKRLLKAHDCLKPSPVRDDVYTAITEANTVIDNLDAR
jgi:hypothetical protein